MADPYSVNCNAPPAVNAGPDETALTGVLYSLQWSFTDANHNGPWSYKINWGDGSTSTGTVSSEGSFTNGHTYVVILRSEEHTSELQSHSDLVCRLLLEKKNKITYMTS